MTKPTQYRISIASQLQEINRDHWQKCSLHSPPFLQYDFLHALESSGSIGGDTGWDTHFIVVYEIDNSMPVAYVPCYLKHHSYGEYVFDHAWANAYHEHGIQYYPKLLIGVPFTPVTSNKVLCCPNANATEVNAFVFDHIHSICNNAGTSSLHWLFNTYQQKRESELHGLPTRLSVQFQWYNQGYQDFDDFLARFTSRKRKDIRKERKKVAEQGILINYYCGESIQADHIAFFYQCYCQTYLKRSGHTGYLTRRFFEQLYAKFARNMMIVVATQSDKPIAAALYLFDDHGLYGRYWGSLREYDGLHFECCYYAGIDFAIQHNIPLFNPGTQGEHKILRGFEPTYCYSSHYVADPRFANAVKNFTQQERPAMERYFMQATNALPFKQNQE
ncbi:GNAT family N-acetyltransferase [Alteromonas oceanisediminis]|uniref:GNAT family N-acetyltransferase n=1 Tax=Alteromonas oceanisediminis TaxID=2836180 RepID=UPI001BDA8763|nr:GNAT family N-acetyltransferase [Alteromonas oceanisediminis]MBT0584886.1 GNAT family N-acetyltransferase [Alteromonas oceanisediminis]